MTGFFFLKMLEGFRMSGRFCLFFGKGDIFEFELVHLFSFEVTVWRNVVGGEDDGMSL